MDLVQETQLGYVRLQAQNHYDTSREEGTRLGPQREAEVVGGSLRQKAACPGQKGSSQKGRTQGGK